MNQNYSIEEILSAVNEIQNNHKDKKKIISRKEFIKHNFSKIPKDTLKLIEEAEKVKK